MNTKLHISTKKVLHTFVIIVCFGFCGFYELIFADISNNPSVEKNISYALEKKGIEKVKSGFAMKVCRGIDSIKTTKKIVALTFDDGPHRKYTEEILAILKLNNIRATFFVIGKNAERYPNIIKSIYANANVVANHTYSHYYLTSLSNEDIEAELMSVGKIIKDLINVYPVLFRPPYGACSQRSVELVNKLGFITVGWSDMVNDYDVGQTTPEKISEEIVKYAKPGAIIGMHDGGGNRSKTVAALPVIIKVLKSQGYEFLTVPELLGVEAYKR